jgi:hypothetical protein
MREEYWYERHWREEQERHEADARREADKDASAPACEAGKP